MRRKTIIVAIIVVCVLGALTISLNMHYMNPPTEKTKFKSSSIAIFPDHGLIKINETKFRYISLDIDCLSPYSYDEFTLIFQGVKFHYIPLLTTGGRMWRFEVMFPDNSVENLTICLPPPPPLGPPREKDYILSLSEHSNPKAGLLLNISSGLLYLIVSQRSEIRSVVSTENENWYFEMKLNTTELQIGNALRIDLKLMAKKNIKLKGLTNPSFSIEIYDSEGKQIWKFFPPAIYTLNYSINAGESINFSWTLKIVEFENESDFVSKVHLPIGNYTLLSTPLTDPSTELTLSARFCVKEKV